MPRKKNGKPNKSKWSPHIEAMVNMANNGASYTEIGEAFGAPASAIRNALTRRGKYVTRKDVAKMNRQPEKTLRDEFAMAALISYLVTAENYADAAKFSYEFADAMMKERME